jgi:hypothetical protein
MFKVVFVDSGSSKRIEALKVDVSDSDLVKITTEDNRTLFVNKNKIVFIKELRQGEY